MFPWGWLWEGEGWGGQERYYLPGSERLSFGKSRGLILPGSKREQLHGEQALAQHKGDFSNNYSYSKLEHGGRNGNQLQYSCQENPMDREA